MFRFLERKRANLSLTNIIELEDHSFVNAVSRMVTEDHLASGTMCLIANENLRPVMEATFSSAKAYPQKNLPEDLDGFIRYLARQLAMQSDGILKRRLEWFFLVSLIWRANAKASTNSALADSAADIWVFLSKSGELLQETIVQNKLWEEDEKVWFEHIQTTEDGVKYVLVHMLPSFLKRHDKIRALAKEHNVILSFAPGRPA